MTESSWLPIYAIGKELALSQSNKIAIKIISLKAKNTMPLG